MTPGTNQSVRRAAETLRKRGVAAPTIGIVLGSGLGSFADEVEDAICIPYSEIPDMPVPCVAGHAGNLVVGRIGPAASACLAGRVHAYEGESLERVVFGVWLLAELGCTTVLLTNAAGGVNPSFGAGDLMLIVDHLNLTGQTPLRGPHPGLGPRFVDMTHAYDAAITDAARRAANEQGIALREGIYAAMCGPNYETPAEVRMLRMLGADAVGMSTVPEVLALRYLGVRVGAVSCITNPAAGLVDAPLEHTEVQRVAALSRERFTRLLTTWIEILAKDACNG